MQVHNLGGIDADFAGVDAFGGQEGLNLLVGGFNLAVEGRQVVADTLVHQRPRHFVGGDFHLCQTFHGDHTVAGCQCVDARFDKIARQCQSDGKDDGFNS